ncbi:putative serine protease [Desulfotignum phosphitoxidans DSM 13687]|uniref:Putative serine protease n=2 Tax=Desulfotignum phosphitoxidans TaxID=190898 RepID=S0FWN6_9BACT|nr:putative serine protease [Desulfotignum phosphitoxidans DSM 13687]
MSDPKNYKPINRRFYSFFILCLVFLLFASTSLAGMDPLPTRFDLRDIDKKAYIGPVKNQNPFGTCYSFGANAAAESTYNRAMGLYNDQAVSFSESFIIWSLGQKYDGFPGGNYGAGADYAYDELQGLVDYGVVPAHVFPYTPELMNLYNDDENLTLNYHWDVPRVQFSGWHRLPANDIETFKRAIMTFGALDVAVLAQEDFSFYEGGIFSDDLTEASFPLEFYSPTNHAVSLVGWDDDEQVWILRNSWGPGWGEDGYMRISYHSARVALEGTYLRYGDWEGVDHDIINTTGITADLQYSGVQPVARGLYEWGGNHASMVNESTIDATISVDEGNPYVHGMFLWAGRDSLIENHGSITAASRSENDQSTAYGIVLQGHKVLNTGSIQVEAEAMENDRATAYGIRMFGFDDTAVLTNEGNVVSEAPTPNGWAYGLFGSGLSKLINNGQVTAKGNGMGAGVMTYDDTTVQNTGVIESHAEDGSSFGVFQYGGRLTNSASGKIVATSNQGESTGIGGGMFDYFINAGTITSQSSQGFARGIFVSDSKFIMNSGLIDVNASGMESESYGVLIEGETRFENTGTIRANATNTAFGAAIQNRGTLINHPGATISASSSGGDAFAISLDHAIAINNGMVTGDTLLDNDSLLMGNGIHTGDLLSNFSQVTPGNSIGTLTVTGDYHQGAGSTLAIEVDQSASDILHVSGTAFLDGTLHIIPIGYVSDSSHTFLNAAGISGAFTTISSPAVFDIDISDNALGLGFDLNRNSYTSLVSNPAHADMADILDHTRPSASNDIADILNLLDTMDMNGLDRAMGNIYPAMHGAAGYAVLGNIQRNNRHLQRQMDLTDAFRFTDPDPDADPESDDGQTWRSWATATGSETRHHSHGAVPGFREKTGGLMVGADHKPTDKKTFGGAIAVSYQNLDGKMNIGQSTIESYQGFLYSQWTETQEGQGAYVNTGLGAGIVEIDTDRTIHFLNRTATSDHTAQTGALFMGTGYGFKYADWLVRPGFDMNYAFMHEDSFTESGADSMTLDVDSRTSYSLQSHIGLNLSRKLTFETGELIPEFRIGWIHEFFPDPKNFNARFHDTPYSFEAPGRDMPKNSGLVGASLKTRFSRVLFGAFDYDYYFMEANQGSAHKFNIQIQYHF